MNLTEVVKQSRIDFLAKEILKHDELYWAMGTPELTDIQYDELCQALAAFMPNHPVLAQVHRAVLPKGKTVRHETEMLSLSKAYGVNEVLAWARGVARDPEEKFRVSIKFDGVASEVTSEGQLVTAGDDGWEGEDITDKMIVVDFSSRLTPIGTERGELLVLKSVLPHLRRSGGEKYKTERAAAVGLINADDTDRAVGRVIKFMPHDYAITIVTLSQLPQIDWSGHIANVQASDYPADGLVIALVDKEYGESLGSTQHHPHHSIAFKFTNPKGITKVIDIEWQVGKNRITPVAILEPVVISGCTHDRASLHNLKFMEDSGVVPGAKVEVERCGDVIPQISKVLKLGNKQYDAPMKCPACDSPTYIDGLDLKCNNPSCGGMAAKRLLDALVRIGVDGVGPGVASALVRAGNSNIMKCFNMTVSDWLKVEGFAEKSAKAMARQFDLLRQKPIEDFRILAAQNIEGIGLTLAKVICSKLAPIDFTTAALRNIDGVGDVRANQIMQGFDHSLWMFAVANLQVVMTQGLADRQKICFTGTDPMGMGRDALIKLAESRGYAYAKAVTKDLKLLVASRLDSTKARKAQQYGVKTVEYNTFLNSLTNLPIGDTLCP